MFVEELTEPEAVGEFGTNQLAQELKNREWLAFRPDITKSKINLVAAKNWAMVQIPVNASSLHFDQKGKPYYGFQLSRFEPDPRMFMAFCAVRSMKPPLDYDFYIVPSTKMDEIPRFKLAYESPTFIGTGEYKCNLSPDKLEENLVEYKNERGFEGIESLGRVESLVDYLKLLKPTI